MKVNIATLFSVVFYLISASSFAEAKSDLVNALSDCAKIATDNQRLRCFDKLAASKAELLPQAVDLNGPVSNIEPIKLKAAKKVDDFSKQHLKKTKQEQGLDSITAKISKLNKLLRGQWVIYLENGQKWQQKDDAKMKLALGDKVLLKKGSMGVVYLYKEGSHRNIRVKRLK